MFKENKNRKFSPCSPTASTLSVGAPFVTALALVVSIAPLAEAQWATRGHLAPKLKSQSQAPSADIGEGKGRSRGDNAPAQNGAGGASSAPILRPRPSLGATAAPGPEALKPGREPASSPPKPSKKPKPARIVSIGKLGPVCESEAITGQPLSSIADLGGCAIAKPVRVRRVTGVAMSPHAVSGCGVPQALERWLTLHVQPAAEQSFGVKVARIHHVSAYVCRNRNGVGGGKLSFHATGDALDIAAFELSDGRRVSVLDDWGGQGPMGEPGAAFLRNVWTGACGVFGTVLGPEADAAHKDHFHLDVAQRRTAFCQ